jgi:hypothetical protein
VEHDPAGDIVLPYRELMLTETREKLIHALAINIEDDADGFHY